MDVQFWIWVAIVVITFLARAGKKKRENNAPTESYPSDTESSKPMTFGDLLREIQEAKAPAPPPPPVKTPAPAWQNEVVDYDDQIPEEEKSFETVTANYKRDDAIYETYEKAKREAFSRPSLEETARLSDTIVRFDQFKKYQKKEHKGLVSRYLEDFKDPEGFKKAFVMSEILKRRF